MNNLDYITGNTLTRYPFKDTAPLVCTAGELPNDAFLDARLILISPGNTQIYCHLDTLTCDIADIEDPSQCNFSITFGLVGLAVGPQIITFTGVTLNGTTSLVRLEAEEDAYKLYVDVDGRALYRFCQDTELTGLNNLTFTTEDAICASAITLGAPLVTLKFSNQVDSQTTQELATVTSGSITVAEGTNIDLSGSDELKVNLTPGGGIGLFDACEDLRDVIRTLNGIASDTYNNFTFTNDPCYRVRPAANGIQVSNECKPQCSEEELQNFARYLNRLRNGTVDIVALITELKKRYDELVALYVQIVDQSKKRQPIFMKAEQGYTKNKVKGFNNLTCAIYSPNKDSVHPVTLAVGYDTSYFTYVPSSSYLTQKGAKTPLHLPGFEGQTLYCNDVLYTGFVLASKRPSRPKVDIGVYATEEEAYEALTDQAKAELEVKRDLVNFGDAKYDISFTLFAETDGAYAVVPLLCATPNFLANYSKVYDPIAQKTKIKITAYPFYKEPGVMPIGMNFECSPSMEFKKGSYSSGSAVATPITNRFGFEANLDLSVNTTVQMEYEVTGSHPNLNFNIGLGTGKGTAFKSFPLSV